MTKPNTLTRSCGHGSLSSLQNNKISLLQFVFISAKQKQVIFMNLYNLCLLQRQTRKPGRYCLLQGGFSLFSNFQFNCSLFISLYFKGILDHAVLTEQIASSQWFITWNQVFSMIFKDESDRLGIISALVWSEEPQCLVCGIVSWLYCELFLLLFSSAST